MAAHSAHILAFVVELATTEPEHAEQDHQSSSQITKLVRTNRSAVLATIAAAASFVRDKKVRFEDYVEVILPRYTVDDFRNRFRLCRDSFQKFLELMSPLMIPPGKISTEKKLLVYLKYVGSQLNYQSIADMFGMCETTVHDIVHKVSKLISSKLLHQLISWPSGNAVKIIENGFSEMQGFPGIIGAIDGSHIAIKTPIHCPENYINRKGFPSIILQAVCDPSMKFIDICCGWPGSVHDARVFRNSSLCQITDDNIEAVFPNDTHLLGDAAYPISPWLLVPFKKCGNLTAAQRLYNYKHSSTRMVIERAFGALKGRFRRLKFIDIYDIETIVHIIISCCAIHQLCLDTSEDIQEYITEGTSENEEVQCLDDIMYKSKNGLQKRNAIVEILKPQKFKDVLWKWDPVR